MTSHEAEAVRGQVRAHLRVFWVLLLVVGLNVAATFLPVDRAVRTGFQVTLAVGCAALVLAFYMHLLTESVSTYLLLGLTGFLCVALLTLTIVARHSVPDLTRSTVEPAPAGAPVQHVP